MKQALKEDHLDRVMDNMQGEVWIQFFHFDPIQLDWITKTHWFDLDWTCPSPICHTWIKIGYCDKRLDHMLDQLDLRFEMV